MPYNVTVDDISPLIIYRGQWMDSYNLVSDPFTSRYLGKSFHSSNTTGSQAFFQFNGTAVYIFGAKRINHGQYSVQVDNEQPEAFSGYAPIQPDGTDGVYQVPLYARTGLENSLHNATLTNEGETNSAQPYVDIDFVTWTSSDRLELNKILDDGDFEYTPSNAWNISSQRVVEYYGKSEHLTQHYGASASLYFEGSGIYLYGGTLDDHGAYTISLDDHIPVTLNGFTEDFHPQNLLFYADGLGSGTHKITVTNADTQGKYIDIDYVNIIQPLSAPAWNRNGKLNSSTIAGIVGIIAAVVALISVAMWWIRQRNRLKLESTGSFNAECEPYSVSHASHAYSNCLYPGPSTSSLSLASNPPFVPQQQTIISQVPLPDLTPPRPPAKSSAIMRGARVRDEQSDRVPNRTWRRVLDRSQPLDHAAHRDGSNSAASPPSYHQATEYVVPRRALK